MSDQATFCASLNLSSVPVVNLNKKHLPVKGIGSGCFFTHNKRKVFGTVAHNKKTNKFAIQLKFVEEVGTAVYPLKDLRPASLITASDREDNPVDFCYQEIPPDIEAFYQEVDELSQKIKKSVLLSTHLVTSISPPDKSKEYGFCGLAFPSLDAHWNVTFFEAKRVAYTGLRFIGEKDNLYYFQLPFKHPGHKWFKGCSGAPIMAEDGTIVSLLKGGDKSQDVVWGIPLIKFRSKLMIELS